MHQLTFGLVTSNIQIMRWRSSQREPYLAHSSSKPLAFVLKILHSFYSTGLHLYSSWISIAVCYFIMPWEIYLKLLSLTFLLSKSLNLPNSQLRKKTIAFKIIFLTGTESRKYSWDNWQKIFDFFPLSQKKLATFFSGWQIIFVLHTQFSLNTFPGLSLEVWASFFK